MGGKSIGNNTYKGARGTGQGQKFELSWPHGKLRSWDGSSELSHIEARGLDLCTLFHLYLSLTPLERGLTLRKAASFRQVLERTQLKASSQHFRHLGVSNLKGDLGWVLWTECLCPPFSKFVCQNHNSQRDATWRWDIWEVVRVRLGHEGEAPIMGLMPL